MHFEREIQENLNVFKTTARSRQKFACAHDFGYRERMSCFWLILVVNLKGKYWHWFDLLYLSNGKTDIKDVWTPIEQQRLYNEKNKNTGSFSIVPDVEISS